MAHQLQAPYVPQDSKEVAQVVAGLERGTKRGTEKGNFKCKKSTFATDSPNGLTVDSWRLNDWDYKRHDLPTYARGFFTYSHNGRPEIAVRGYDKFFNVDETNDTQWRNIETNTRGPYELSLKENGCIIFISGLADDTLLVCSKHSTGARDDTDLSHAKAGEKWVDRHLASVGRTRAELARELRRRNVTAVGELCDDTFEEHILAYGAERAGIYLHGINLNVLEFTTYPGPLVDSFAEAWGFRKTFYLVKDNIFDVRTFLEGVAETGAWNGMDVEGFVIRCKKGHGERGPYQDWFFKYKFEEPYLMYRQWREVTKSIISGKVPKYKKHVKITAEYLNYARRQLAENRNLGKAFNQNHGIIAMRDGFLAEKGLKGSDIIRLEEEDEKHAPRNVTKDVFLVPIATLGCGKTTIAKALEKLLGWAHIQNDDVQGKRGRPAQFVSLIFSASAASPVVFADRNNAERRERAQVIDDLTAMIPDARFVALYWDHDEEGTMRRQEVRHVLRSRVMGRGDNHQTIQAATKDEQHITGIMENFMRRFQPVNPYEEPDSGFDSVITLDPTAESRDNLQTVVTQLHATYPGLFKEMPSSDDLDDAMDYALHDYHPDLRHSVGPSQKKNGKASGQADVTPKGKVRKVSYFAIKLPSTPILEALRCSFPNPEDPTARFYMYLRQMRRVQAAFHVTLIHKAQASAFPQQWSRYSALHKQSLEAQDKTDAADPELGVCKVQLERVVWDDRVMSIVARLVDAEDGWETINRVAHITIGTADDSIKPKESNALLERWMAGEKGINDLLIKGSPLVEGSVRAVQQ